MQSGWLRPAIVNRHTDQHIFGIRLRVLYKNIEVPILIKQPRIEKFIFQIFPRSLSVFIHQLALWELLLWILVQVLHVRMGRGAIEIEVLFLHILAMVSCTIGEAKESL